MEDVSRRRVRLRVTSSRVETAAAFFFLFCSLGPFFFFVFFVEVTVEEWEAKEDAKVEGR